MSVLNDIKAKVLASLGYTGSLNDAELQFWLNYQAPSAPTLAQIQAISGTDGSKYVRILTGVATPTGNGATVIFNIPHGAATLPVYANVVGGNSLSTGTKFVTFNANNIVVTFDVAPGAGTLSLEWIVLVN